MTAILPLLSTIVSVVFAGATFSQWLSRRKPYQLVWTLGLLMYGLGAGSEYVAAVWGLSDPVYRLWYLAGAILVAAYLGMGTVYLLAPRNYAHAAMAILVLGSIYAAYKVFGARIDLQLLPGGPTGISGVAMPGDVRLLTPLFNIFGTVGLVGGAAYSAWVFWRKRILPRRMVSCILIAVGGVLPAFGGTLMRFGIPELFFLMEFLGVSVIFAGFLVNTEILALRTARDPAPAPSRG